MSVDLPASLVPITDGTSAGTNSKSQFSLAAVRRSRLSPTAVRGAVMLPEKHTIESV